MRYNDQFYLRARRRQAGGARWIVIIRTFFFLVLAVCLALFYVWQNVQLVRMGFKIKEKEKVVLELTKKSRSLEIDLSVLKMPNRIMEKVQEKGLDLKVPEMWKIVKIQTEPVLYEEDLLNLNMGQDTVGSGSMIDISAKLMND